MALPAAATRATKYEIGSPSSHLVTLARQRQLGLRLLAIFVTFLFQKSSPNLRAVQRGTKVEMIVP